METELRSIRQAAQNQERTIQSLSESLNTKETEVRAYTHTEADQSSEVVLARQIYVVSVIHVVSVRIIGTLVKKASNE